MWLFVLIVPLLVGCGSSKWAVRQSSTCHVRLPTVSERAKAAVAAHRITVLSHRADASVLRLIGRDDEERPIDAKLLRAGQRERRDAGVLATAEATRAVMLAAPGRPHEMGVPLTPAEGRLLDYRGELVNYAPLARRYAHDCLRSDYGGIWFGGDKRGQFFAIAIATSSARARAEIMRRSAIDPRFLRVPHVRFTLAELTATKEQVARDAERAGDLATAGVSESRNRVELTLDPYTDQRATQLRRQFGAILTVSPGTRPTVV